MCNKTYPISFDELDKIEDRTHKIQILAETIDVIEWEETIGENVNIYQDLTQSIYR